MNKFLLFLIVALVSALPAVAAKDAPMLPASFSGWQKMPAGARAGTDLAVVDAADAEVLKEYGFSDLEAATYTRDNRQMQIKAARFHDASGAYGAFTFYLQPQMQKEDIPDQGASNNSRILFYRGNILVDVKLDRATAMSAADLRTLSETLPRPRGSSATLPSLPANLPRQSYIPHTARYVVGTMATARLGLPVPAALVDFTKGAEVAFAKYQGTRSEANLTLIGYPTPQIAAEQLRAIQAASLPGGPFFYKRSGPLVAIVNGSMPDYEVQSLLASVNYDADVTWSQPTKFNPRDNIGNLIIGVFSLIGLLLLFAIVIGVAFGGVRVITKKLFPNRVFDRPEDIEIIQLNLK